MSEERLQSPVGRDKIDGPELAMRVERDLAEANDVPHVSVSAEWYDLAVRSQAERDKFREELHQARKVIGQAILQLHQGWSTNALQILEGSVVKP